MYRIDTPEKYNHHINTVSDGLLDARLFTPEMSELANLYNQGVRLERDGQLQQANETYDRLLTRWPTFVAGRYNLACNLSRLGQQGPALEHLEVCHRFDPNDTDVLMLTGVIHGELGEPLTEVMYYQRVHALDARHHKALEFLALTYRQLGWWTIARGWLEVLDALVRTKLEQDPRSVTREQALGFEWNAGMVHEHFGNLAQALEHFETAAQVSGGTDEALRKVAEIRRRLGREW